MNLHNAPINVIPLGGGVGPILALVISFSSPEPTILLVCARDRDLWQGPKQEVRESRTSGFCAQPQKFKQ